MKRKFLFTSLLLVTTMTILAGCGSTSTKEYGHQEVLEQVADGTYNPNSVSTNTDAVVNEQGWVIESANYEDCSDEIKALTKDLEDGYAPYLYVGYKVDTTTNTIKYAFSAFNPKNQKSIVYVIQTVDNKLTYEFGDYSDIQTILVPEEELNDYVPEPDPSTLITEPGYDPQGTNDTATETDVESTETSDDTTTETVDTTEDVTTEESSEDTDVKDSGKTDSSNISNSDRIKDFRKSLSERL